MRCEQCNKLLGKLQGKAEIKCSRCGKINKIKL
ncbi:zinc finger domain-containing protein [Halalkalibacter oceani]